jgi:hypothetical protein
MIIKIKTFSENEPNTELKDFFLNTSEFQKTINE